MCWLSIRVAEAVRGRSIVRPANHSGPVNGVIIRLNFTIAYGSGRPLSSESNAPALF